jgi:hypothetical protein
MGIMGQDHVSTPKTCPSCGTVTAEHLPDCTAKATVNRLAWPWQVAGLLAVLFVIFVLLVVVAALFGPGPGTVFAGSVIAGIPAIVLIADKWSEAGRGRFLSKWLRVTLWVLLMFGILALLPKGIVQQLPLNG